jgi:Protein of unknown function (DUF2442)
MGTDRSPRPSFADHRYILLTHRSDLVVSRGDAIAFEHCSGNRIIFTAGKRSNAPVVVDDEESIAFHLQDGRVIIVPTAFYFLTLATPHERHFDINVSSVHWPDVDVDIGVERMLSGARARHALSQSRAAFAWLPV